LNQLTMNRISLVFLMGFLLGNPLFTTAQMWAAKVVSLERELLEEVDKQQKLVQVMVDKVISTDKGNQVQGDNVRNR
jgi:hypothetical protein